MKFNSNNYSYKKLLYYYYNKKLVVNDYHLTTIKKKNALMRIATVDCHATKSANILESGCQTTSEHPN